MEEKDLNEGDKMTSQWCSQFPSSEWTGELKSICTGGQGSPYR